MIGQFSLNNLPKLKAGKARVEVIFFIDENNILNVSAKDVSNELNKNEIVIVNKDRKINDEQIKKIKENIKKFDENENNLNLNGAELLKMKLLNLEKKFKIQMIKKKNMNFKRKFVKILKNLWKNLI